MIQRFVCSETVLIIMILTDNALAVASRNLNTDHRPDFTNTEPAANIGPFPQWSDPKKIVAMDPLGKCCDELETRNESLNMSL